MSRTSSCASRPRRRRPPTDRAGRASCSRPRSRLVNPSEESAGGCGSRACPARTLTGRSSRENALADGLDREPIHPHGASRVRRHRRSGQAEARAGRLQPAIRRVAARALTRSSASISVDDRRRFRPAGGGSIRRYSRQGAAAKRCGRRSCESSRTCRASRRAQCTRRCAAGSSRSIALRGLRRNRLLPRDAPDVLRGHLRQLGDQGLE